ncbi:MAG: rhodanese-like domain-containing protein [Terriglobia bacterium]
MHGFVTSKRSLPALLLALISVAVPLLIPAASGPMSASAVPWRASQIITPAELAKEIALSKDRRPVIICVGFDALYRGGHVPGALCKGPARDASGIEQLRAWARSTPKDTRVVIYCGCCPFVRCPNVRPAFETLRAEGLTHVQVLDIEDTFVNDWTQKGYPTQKGQ